MRETIRVIAIAGTGQNGATLCCRLLGELPGCIAVGEIGRLWDKGLVEDVECACGSPFSRCPFWSQVGKLAFGGWGALDQEEALRLYERLTLKRSRFPHPFALPLILMPWLSKDYTSDLRDYEALMHRLYGGILEVSGAHTIIDSMKVPAHVFMLQDHSGLKVDIIHLIRDPRGVVYSNTKKVVRQGNDAERPYRVQRTPLKTTSKWIWFNLAHSALAALGARSMRLRYEDLAANPEDAIRSIAAFANLVVDDRSPSFVHGSVAHLGAGHIPAGNRMRLVSGPIEIRADDDWSRKLSRHDRRLVTALTWPLLQLYGFRRQRRPRIAPEVRRDGKDR